MSLYTVWQYIFFFFLYSMLGWISEVIFAALDTGKLVNRGFLNGPLCPIYGSGMVAILFLIGRWADNVLVVFFGGMLITTLVELIGGIILYRAFHTRWWDYSDQPFNLGGYICLKFSLMWGLGSILLVMVFHPLIEKPVLSIPETPLVVIDLVLLALFAVDLGLSIAAAIGLNKRMTQIEEARSAMRVLSDKLTEVVGSSALNADELLDEQKLQLALARMEGRDNMEQLRTEFEARAAEATARYRAAVNQLEQNTRFGPGRLLKAFPRMKSRDHADTVARLRARAGTLAQRARKAVKEAVQDTVEEWDRDSRPGD
ncbi:MAG: putative ABC transporter permease [Gemmiger sp.]